MTEPKWLTELATLLARSEQQYPCEPLHDALVAAGPRLLRIARAVLAEERCGLEAVQDRWSDATAHALTDAMDERRAATRALHNDAPGAAQQ